MGIEKSKFKNLNFSISIAVLDSLQKSMNVKWSSFFHAIMSQITEKVKFHKQKGNDVHLFANLNVFS